MCSGGLASSWLVAHTAGLFLGLIPWALPVSLSPCETGAFSSDFHLSFPSISTYSETFIFTSYPQLVPVGR